MKQWKKAENSYREALQLFPEYPPSHAAIQSLGNLGFFKRLLPFI